MTTLSAAAVVLGVVMALVMAVVPFTIVVVLAVLLGSILAMMRGEPAGSIALAALALICCAQAGYLVGVLARTAVVRRQKMRRKIRDPRVRPAEKI